jgi:hypothetical protein
MPISKLCGRHLIGVTAALVACSSGATSGPGANGNDSGAPSPTAEAGLDATFDSPGLLADAAGDSSVDASLDAGSDAVADARGDSSDGDGGRPTAPNALSQTGLFTSIQPNGALVLAEGVTEYQPLYPLWSDGAEKTRWIYLPPGTRIDTTDQNHWSFPAGTKFWKEFALDGQRIETRLLWMYGSGADDYLVVTYAWDSDAGTATEATIANPNFGQNVAYGPDGGSSWHIPSQNDCHTCHDSLEEHVLGFGAIELNHSLPGLNIGGLIDGGLLTSNPSLSSLAIPGDATTQAALGYLHTNCGICHNVTPGYQGIPTPPMLLRIPVDAGAAANTPTYQTTVNQATTDFTSLEYRIAGQEPAQSMVLLTMMTRGGQREAMPPLASNLVDDAGVAAVTAWVMTLPLPEQ